MLYEYFPEGGLYISQLPLKQLHPSNTNHVLNYKGKT